MANLLQEDIRKSANRLGLVHRRLRDMNMYKGSSSPFDELILSNTKVLALECKLLRKRKNSNPKSIPFSRLSDNQREGLLEWDKKDICDSYLLVNFRWIDHKKGKCFALPITEFIYLEQALDRKSIPLDYFENNVLELPRYKEGWDLRLLL